jgi:hypothetical protein
MARARQSWKDSGLPDFEIPNRARLRLERS